MIKKYFAFLLLGFYAGGGIAGAKPFCLNGKIDLKVDQFHKEKWKTAIKESPSYGSGMVLVYSESKMVAKNLTHHFFSVDSVKLVRYIVETNCSGEVVDIILEMG